MTISFHERLTQRKQGVEPAPYQDAVSYPCFSPGGVPGIGSDGANVPEQTGSIITTTTEKLLQRLIDIEGGGSVPGAYRSVNVTIPASEQRYEIQLGIYATQLNIRCDQDIQLIFNNPQFDTITLEIGDFPLSIADLRMNESIHTLYITTTSETEVQVLAFGSVK